MSDPVSLLSGEGYGACRDERLRDCFARQKMIGDVTG